MATRNEDPIMRSSNFMEKRQPSFSANYWWELLGLFAHFQKQITPQIWNENTGFLEESQVMLSKIQTPGYGKGSMYARQRKENTKLPLGKNQLPLVALLECPRQKWSAITSSTEILVGSRKGGNWSPCMRNYRPKGCEWANPEHSVLASSHRCRLELVKC